MMVLNRLTKTVMIVFGLFFGLTCLAQESTEQAQEVKPDKVANGPEDILGRGTPRGTATAFLEACSEFDFEKAAKYLDLRSLPPDVSRIGGEELARQLNHVLSRNIWLDEFAINDSPEGAKGDGLPDYRDSLATIETSGKEFAIWVQRVPRDDGELIWKISNRSLALVPFLYDEFSYLAPVETVRKWFPQDASWLGVEAFKWFLLLIVMAVCWPVFWILGWILIRLSTSPQNDLYPLIRSLFTGPFVLVSTLLVMSVTLNHLGVGSYAQKILDSKTLIIIAIVWALWAVINLYKRYKQIRMTDQGRSGEARLVQPITTLVKLSVLTLGTLFWLSNIGVNITAVLAGFGIGGLAVALALQKPIEDLMGAFSIFSQATIRVGDHCGYGNITGVVEDIGLRSTRLRSFGNTIISIPNSSLAYAEIENFTARKKIRYFPTLRIGYDATEDQLQRVTSGIVEMLNNDSRVDDNSLYARFLDFTDDAILIKVNSYIKTTDFLTFLEVSEDLNLKIVRIVHASGTRFALPGKTIYMDDQHFKNQS